MHEKKNVSLTFSDEDTKILKKNGKKIPEK